VPTPDELFEKSKPGNITQAREVVLAYLETDGAVSDWTIAMLVHGFRTSADQDRADEQLQELVEKWYQDAGKKRPAPDGEPAR
jgi:hypothetical protein